LAFLPLITAASSNAKAMPFSKDRTNVINATTGPIWLNGNPLECSANGSQLELNVEKVSLITRISKAIKVNNAAQG
jgi:hypothetical protein